jgi:hypothetical protein
MFGSLKLGVGTVSNRPRIPFAVTAILGALALAAVGAMALVAAPTALADSPGAPSGDGVQPVLVPGDPTCEDVLEGGYLKLKVEPVEEGTYSLGDFEVTIDVTATLSGPLFDFTANYGLDAVIVKGGANANSFVYDPEDAEDTDLHAPVRDADGTFYSPSSISFCIDSEQLEVDKTADTTFTRDYDWAIDKTCDESELELSVSQSYDVTCDVTVSIAGVTDSDWAVSGDITVHNPAPVDATGVDVTDVISGYGPANQLECDGDGTTNRTIPAQGDLTCHYSAGPFTDGSDRTNTATASDSTTPGISGGSSDPVDVKFVDPTTEEDDCVDVTDDKIGDLGEVCLDDLDENDEYTFEDVTYTIGSPETDECGEFDSINVASFTTNTNGDTDSDDHTVTINVVGCDGGGCTLTPGYWKTHSEMGPAPYDDNWANLGSQTLFFLSGQTYYEVLWTPPKGNAYYILARAYIAAQLNILHGADPTDAQAAFDEATGLFGIYTPGDVAALKGKNGKETRAQFIALAETLDAYNNGLIGPGHCDEDGNSSG